MYFIFYTAWLLNINAKMSKLMNSTKKDDNNE